MIEIKDYLCPCLVCLCIYLTFLTDLKWKRERRSGWHGSECTTTHISTGTAHGGHGIGTNSAGFEADLNPAGQPFSGD